MFIGGRPVKDHILVTTLVTKYASNKVLVRLLNCCVHKFLGNLWEIV